MRKFAFAVEIEPNEVFEIFEVVSVPDTFLNIQNGWLQGLSRGASRIVQISGVDGISSGDTYADGVFTNKSQTNSFVMSDNVVAFALISNSIVYGFVSIEKNSFTAEKYLAAVQENTAVFDVTDISNVAVGTMWDGSAVIPN
jgi:hypothetical protein